MLLELSLTIRFRIRTIWNGDVSLFGPWQG